MKKTVSVIVFIFICTITYATGVPSLNGSSDKTAILPTEISQTDSRIDVDKKAVIVKTVQEVFTNYAQKIDSLKKNFNALSVMEYIDTYLKEETVNIETQISDKSYIHRYSANEKSWIESDFSEVNAILKVRTIDRIKEISKDIENEDPGVFSAVNYKLELLIKEVNAEIKN